MIYRHYSETHQAISSLTSTFADFCEILPETVFFETAQEVQHVAFIEQNEIAYVASRNLQAFKPFIATVVGHLLENFATITFEADDCDPVAMELLSLFYHNEKHSFNSYIRNSILGRNS